MPNVMSLQMLTLMLLQKPNVTLLPKQMHYVYRYCRRSNEMPLTQMQNGMPLQMQSGKVWLLN